MGQQWEDLTGKRFGRLVVIGPAKSPDGKRGRRWWECLCDCGNIKIAPTVALKSGKTKSCGCMRDNDCGTEHYNFKGNKFIEINEKYCVGVDSQGEEFIISACDYDEVSKYCWTAQAKTSRRAKGGAYFSARMSRKSPEGHKMKMLQNFVWELHYGKIPKGKIIDHINRLPKDNRTENLRLSDKSGNSFNSIRTRVSNSGVVGVMFCQGKYHHNKWRAYINIGSKRKELGYFNTKEQAILARLQAELIYWNEICPGNILAYEKYKEKIP